MFVLLTDIWLLWVAHFLASISSSLIWDFAILYGNVSYWALDLNYYSSELCLLNISLHDLYIVGCFITVLRNIDNLLDY